MNKPLSHVLCVDDEDDILSIVKLCLEDIGGLRASCFTEIDRALGEAAGLLPDLIMLDVMMPRMTGLQAIRQLRQKPSLAQTPIILMTARIQPKEIEEYLAGGADGVIAKPFDPMTLVDQIKDIWENVHGR